jgi:hypothetical protein
MSLMTVRLAFHSELSSNDVDEDCTEKRSRQCSQVRYSDIPGVDLDWLTLQRFRELPSSAAQTKGRSMWPYDGTPFTSLNPTRTVPRPPPMVPTDEATGVLLNRDSRWRESCNCLDVRGRLVLLIPTSS